MDGRSAAPAIITLTVPVFRITHDGPSPGGEVDPQLMGPSGDRFAQQQGHRTRFGMTDGSDAPHPGDGNLSALLYTNPSLALRIDPFVQGCLDDQSFLLWRTPHQREVLLAHLSLAELSVKLHQCGASTREKNQTRGFPVKPVDQFEKSGCTPGNGCCCIALNLTQSLDQSESDAASTMDSQTRRLVDGQEISIVEYRLDRVGNGSGEFGGGPTLACTGHAGWPVCGHAHRRDAQAVLGFEAVVACSPPPIDPNLSGAQHFVNTGLGHPAKTREQEIVDPLSSMIFRNNPVLDPPPGGGDRARSFRRGVGGGNGGHPALQGYTVSSRDDFRSTVVPRANASRGFSALHRLYDCRT